MPSVLIELGFLSNKPEGLFLNSDSGQKQMAEAIANAILSYKKEYFADDNLIRIASENQSSDDIDFQLIPASKNYEEIATPLTFSQLPYLCSLDSLKKIIGQL